MPGYPIVAGSSCGCLTRTVGRRDNVWYCSSCAYRFRRHYGFLVCPVWLAQTRLLRSSASQAFQAKRCASVATKATVVVLVIGCRFSVCLEVRAVRRCRCRVRSVRRRRPRPCAASSVGQQNRRRHRSPRRRRGGAGRQWVPRLGERHRAGNGPAAYSPVQEGQDRTNPNWPV